MFVRHFSRAILWCGVAWVGLGQTGWGQPTRKVTVEALIYDLKHPDQERRRVAAVNLGRHRIHAAVPALSELSRDPDESVRLEVARALAEIGDRRAIPALNRMIEDTDRAVQLKAIEGVLRCYEIPAASFMEQMRSVVAVVNPYTDAYRPVVVEPFIQVDPASVEALGRVVESPRAQVRKTAVRALGILRGEAALDRLTARLRVEDDAQIRVELIRAVSSIGNAQAGRHVIALTRDTNKAVHDHAIYAVGRLRVREAVPHLTDMYRADLPERKKVLGVVPVSSNDDLTRNLFQALAMIGHSDSVPLFLEGLTSEGAFYRRYSAEGLGRAGHQAALTELARMHLSDSSGEVRLALSFALYRLGRTEHLDELVRHARKDQAYRYLLEMETGEITALYPYLKNAGPGVAARLLEVIGLRADQSGLQVAEEMTHHADAEVVAAANLAIRRLRANQPLARPEAVLPESQPD